MAGHFLDDVLHDLVGVLAHLVLMRFPIDEGVRDEAVHDGGQRLLVRAHDGHELLAGQTEMPLHAGHLGGKNG